MAAAKAMTGKKGEEQGAGAGAPEVAMGVGRRLRVGEGGHNEREDDAGAALWTPRREVGHGEQGPEATAASLGSDSGEVQLGGARAWAEWAAVGGDRTRGERRGGRWSPPLQGIWGGEARWSR